ncbi:hypothetical protein BHE74_00048286 [Ensete ventricosum]|nr:hypothetical protein GW17_00017029 [Ensete ventricosum]RWW45840.1 hypothetical protein BHE74_00048286 [Ensete ventricosum]RZS25854.1 hypothetical protein BHM03_00059119 [Ensete ventricosum]
MLLALLNHLNPLKNFLIIRFACAVPLNLCKLQVATFISVYASWGFARIHGIGWGWAGVIWLFSIVTFFPLDILKFIIRYTLSGKAWVNLYESKTAFTTKLDYGKGEREAQWALAQRTLHGLQPPDSSGLFNEKNYRELSEIAEQAKRRAEVASITIRFEKIRGRRMADQEGG